ncbi:hypothetical protein V2J09_005998 [Rumex salicifolius]
MPPFKNPRNWKYTWEAQSQLPLLKLFIFSETSNPSANCYNLQAELKFEISLLVLSWTEKNAPVSLTVPFPKVLVDLECPLNFRALDDHIEVKIGLLLPVDHPIVSGFVSDLYREDGNGVDYQPASDFCNHLILQSDAERLAANGELHFYCRNCSFRLTQLPIRSFVEMPSVDWREAADNWFGSCCCSFGSVSEKMVAGYTKTHACRQGSCLLSTTSIILHQDDFVGFNTSKHYCIREHDEFVNGGDCHVTSDNLLHDRIDKLSLVNEEDVAHKGCHTSEGQTSIQLASAIDETSNNRCCSHSTCESSSKDQELIKTGDLSTYQKLLLNGYLGNIFMFKSSGLSKDIDWVEFECPKCSSLLGAYPSADGNKKPIDGGLRLLKCYISTSPAYSSGDLFSNYTLERMFSAQLKESADDELSFRMAVKDLKTKSLMLQFVLLNPDSWHCSGSCKEGDVELSPPLMMYLHPVIKLLFSATCCANGFGSSMHKRQKKDEMEEVFMLDPLIRQVKRSLELSSSTLPPSLNSLQGFSLAILRR